MAKNSVLTPHQRKFLKIIGQEKYFSAKFYLTGGTALAEFYLKHRLSEDLDFFTEENEVNPVAIVRFLNSRAKILKLEKFDTRRVMGLYSLFLHFQDKTVLKVDFNYYPFPRIEKGSKFGNLTVNSIYDIGVDKVHTIVLNPRARDFIDIFFIVKEKHYDFFDLIMKAKAKFDWDITAIELGARLIEGSKLTDYPHLLKKIAHQEWKDFFLAEAKKLKKEIFK